MPRSDGDAKIMEDGKQPLMGGGDHMNLVDVDAMVRQGFIRKVYGILSVQLLVTCAEIGAFTFINPLRAAMCMPPFSLGGATSNQAQLEAFRASHPQCFVGDTIVPNSTAWGLFYGGWITSFVVIIAMSCCIENARMYPRNMILLGIFTVAEGLFLGVFCCFFDATAVLMAAGITAAVVIALTAFATFTTIDFTGMGMYLYAALIALILCGLFGGIFIGTVESFRNFQYLYACGGVVLFSLYLVYDTQLIVGGQHKKFQFSVDDYVFAALNIYL